MTARENDPRPDPVHAVDAVDETEYIYNRPGTVRYELNEAMEKERGDELRALRENWSWKDDDVIINTFPRSGTHLAWIMARYIVQGSTEPFNDVVEDSHWCMLGLRDVQKGRRVLSSHYLPADYPRDFWTKNGNRKHMVVMRNGKDTAVSYHILMKQVVTIFRDVGSWEDCLEEFCHGITPHGSWFLVVRAWEEFIDRHPELPIMIVYFEDMVTHTSSTVRQMAHFLNCPISEDLVQEISGKCGFDVMKSMALSEMFTQAFNDTEPSAENLFYRKGKIGDWKNHFTVKENEMFEAVYKARMKGSKLRFRYE